MSGTGAGEGARGGPLRRRALLAGLLVAGVVVLGRAFQLQVLESGRWAERARVQQRQRLSVAAPRGSIYDRNGVPLASTQEGFRVGIAPGELRDARAVVRRLRTALGLSEREAERVVSRRQRWAALPGVWDAWAREALEGVRGIYFERVYRRFYPRGEIALELLGGVSAEGRALGGLELEFDSVLRGRPGRAVARRDGRGEPIPGALVSVEEPVPGRDLVLSIDSELQEIAHEALRQAITQTGAAGGELLLADPHSGGILAAASHHRDGARHWRAAAEPYEPGSTLKPFVIAALLAEGKGSLNDRVYAEQGRWVHGGRTMADVHGYGWLTLREALRYSSNIALAKAAERLTAEEQYRYLRDFGFGTPTGVPYPSESSGALRRPREWSGYSKASLAIGYEISVTPLQLLLAYSALANGGVLMEPRLVRAVRGRDGRSVRAYSPRAVRRVIPEEVARSIARALVEVVEGGTGHEADLGTFHVGGKTGTARRYVGGAYESGSYLASFAGFFPAADPQLAFVVMLDRPQSSTSGGMAAAPVTRATLTALLAARRTPLDRRAIAAVPQGTTSSAPAAAATEPAGGGVGPFIFALDAGPPRRFRATTPAPARPVPDVSGLSLRDAVRRLHAQGFRARVAGSGPVRFTVPGGGVFAVPGTLVQVQGHEGTS